MKLTAQFVARNGRQFLTNLMNREQRNYQFDFLRPQHSLFQYFTKLLEQYTKILIPPKDLMERLSIESANSRNSQVQVLEVVKYRANWQKHQESLKKREEEKIERERGELTLAPYFNKCYPIIYISLIATCGGAASAQCANIRPSPVIC